MKTKREWTSKQIKLRPKKEKKKKKTYPLTSSRTFDLIFDSVDFNCENKLEQTATGLYAKNVDWTAF